MSQIWAERVAEDMQLLGGLSDRTFKSLLREMGSLGTDELRALVAALLAFGPAPVSESVREELMARPANAPAGAGGAVPAWPGAPPGGGSTSRLPVRDVPRAPEQRRLPHQDGVL